MRNQVLRALLASTLLVACSSDEASDIDHSTPAVAAARLGVTPLAIDARGLPRLLKGTHVAPAPAATATASATTHLTRLAPAYGVRVMPSLIGVGETATDGGRIARIAQVVDGLRVDGGELRVMIGDGGKLVAATGTLVAGDAPRSAKVFAKDDAGAVATAVAHTHQAFDPAALSTKITKTDGTRILGGTANGVHVEMARATQAWYPVKGVLVAAWIVEAYTSPTNSTDSELNRTVISADGKKILEHRSLKDDVAFKYKVFADATGEFHPKDGPTEDASPHPAGTPNGAFPPYIAPSLVEVEGLNHNADGVADPWLAASRTETLGNNVEAYADFNTPSGLSFGDFRATTTTTRTFDRTYDVNAEPLSSQAQQMAAITSLFFNINWLHDFWYDAGFTETAGNAQDNNYGRGGEDRDAILAEAQDNALGGSRNNANMSTPSDGLPPRMQVFLWSGTEDVDLTVGGNTTATDSAAFGPKDFTTTGPVILGVDTGGVNANDGCEALNAGTTVGKIVLVDRLNCSFKRKALNIQNAGGIGMLLADTNTSNVPPGMGEDTAITTPITISSLSVTMADGGNIKAALLNGAVTATLTRDSGPELDGGLDSTLIAHEYGHYLHHRLSLCGNQMCGAISEGWGDFLALMLLAREGDDLDGAYPFSVYTTQSFSSDPAYYGIRRAPYSVDQAINSLSYRHMADGIELPTSHPFLVFSKNSEVHNAGEIWASTMWEVYVALQKAGTSFTATRAKMAKYVVGGMLMAPPEASPTELRDAILAVINAASPADHEVAAAAFSRRGLGSCAISPLADEECTGTGQSRVCFTAIVESNKVAGRAAIGAQTSEAATTCDDDNTLDPGETLKVTIPVTNRGHKELTNVKATIEPTTPGLTVISDPVTLATVPPYGSANVVAEIKLDGELDAPLAGELKLKIEATGGCEDSTETTISIRLNADDVPETSATDTFDTDTSVWTVTQSDVPIWSHLRETALDGYWHGDAIGATSDTSVVSPIVTVTAQPFVVTLDHKWAFEADANTDYDGGVIEYTTDFGTTWKDVSEIAGTGYTGTLTSDNALGARMAYTGTNPSNPLPDTLTLDFGTQLAGAQVQLRFRIGTDGGVGAPGWDIDNIAMTGISGTPFPTQGVDSGACTPTKPPGDDDGGCCDAGPMRAGNFAAVLGVLALLFWPRRRRRRS